MGASQIIKLSITGLLVVVLSSCKDKSPTKDCGCDGPASKVIVDVSGSYLGDRVLLLRISDGADKKSELWVNVCDAPDSLKISGDIKAPIYNYTVSGDLKYSCFKGETIMAIPPLFTIKRIRKNF